MNQKRQVKINRWLLGPISILMIGLLVALSWPASPLYAQSPAGTITVVGEGKVTIQPDIAVTTIGVEVGSNTVADASAENKALIEAILAALSTQGIVEKDIQTAGFNIYAERFGMEGPLPDDEVQYRVSNTVAVVIRDLEKVGDVLDAAIQAGANSIYGIEFKIEDPGSVESDARQSAVADARTKAEELAALTGVGVGNVVSISEVIGGNGGYYQSNFDEASNDMGGGSGFAPGELSLTMRVQVTYAITEPMTGGNIDEPENPTTGEHTGTTAVPPSALANGTYVGIYDEPITLIDGLYEGEPFVEGGASRPTVTLLDKTASGDINGDGVEDAVAVLVENSGGSASFYYLTALVNEAGTLVNLATQLIGDRTPVEAIRIEDGTILVDVTSHGPDDPLCCPTQNETLIYELADDQLINLPVDALSQAENQFVTIFVGPETVACVGEAPQECLQVKFSEDEGWTFFYDPIEGFTYVAGFEYELLVERIEVENPPADASSFRYSLVDVISKMAATSEPLSDIARPDVLDSELDGTNWVLTGWAAGGDAVASGIDYMTTTTFERGRISGSTGCNRYGGDYIVNGRELTLGAISITMRACAEDVMEREQAFLSALQGVARYAQNANTLELMDANGAVLIVFQPAE